MLNNFLRRNLSKRKPCESPFDLHLFSLLSWRNNCHFSFLNSVPITKNVLWRTYILLQCKQWVWKEYNFFQTFKENSMLEKGRMWYNTRELVVAWGLYKYCLCILLCYRGSLNAALWSWCKLFFVFPCQFFPEHFPFVSSLITPSLASLSVSLSLFGCSFFVFSILLLLNIKALAFFLPASLAYFPTEHLYFFWVHPPFHLLRFAPHSLFTFALWKVNPSDSSQSICVA